MLLFSHYSLINHQLISFHSFKRLQFTTIIKIISTTNMGTATLTNELGQVINRQLNKPRKSQQKNQENLLGSFNLLLMNSLKPPPLNHQNKLSVTNVSC